MSLDTPRSTEEIAEGITRAFFWGAVIDEKKAIARIKEALDADRSFAQAKTEELDRLRKIAERCLDDDEENELNMELNRVGKWMKIFLDGGEFPS